MRYKPVKKEAYYPHRPPVNSLYRVSKKSQSDDFFKKSEFKTVNKINKKYRFLIFLTDCDFWNTQGVSPKY